MIQPTKSSINHPVDFFFYPGRPRAVGFPFPLWTWWSIFLQDDEYEHLIKSKQRWCVQMLIIRKQLIQDSFVINSLRTNRCTNYTGWRSTYQIASVWVRLLPVFAQFNNAARESLHSVKRECVGTQSANYCVGSKQILLSCCMNKLLKDLFYG